MQVREFNLKDIVRKLSDEELKDCLSIMDEDNKKDKQNHLITKIANQFFREVYKTELLQVSTQCGIELIKRLDKQI